MAATFFSGTGSPNGVVFGNPGDAYFDLTGGPPTFWAKQSGVNTNTGWVGLTSGSTLLQTLAANITVDTVIPGGGFVLLPPLSIVINIAAGSSVLAHFTVSGIANVAPNDVFFRLRANGAVVKGATFNRPGGGGQLAASAAIVAKITGLPGGNNTIDIQANTSGGTANINAFSLPDQQHGTLLVEEVTV